MPGLNWLRFGAVSLSLVLPLTSCSDPLAPGSATLDGLELALELTPASVNPHGSFEAELTIRNTRPDTATLHSGCSTIAWIGLFRDGERVSARGIPWGCLTVVTAYTIPPGEELRQRWTITAESPSGDALSRGTYAFRVEFQVHGLPDLEQLLRVR